jgi:hypothetical protein
LMPVATPPVLLALLSLLAGSSRSPGATAGATAPGRGAPAAARTLPCSAASPPYSSFDRDIAERGAGAASVVPATVAPGSLGASLLPRRAAPATPAAAPAARPRGLLPSSPPARGLVAAGEWSDEEAGACGGWRSRGVEARCLQVSERSRCVV